jgi:hypothetical protein
MQEELQKVVNKYCFSHVLDVDGMLYELSKVLDTYRMQYKMNYDGAVNIAVKRANRIEYITLRLTSF